MPLEGARREAVSLFRERARADSPRLQDYDDITSALEPTRVAVVVHSSAARWHAQFLSEHIAATCQTGTDEISLQSGVAGATAALRIEARRRHERPSRPCLAVAVLRGREVVVAVSGQAAVFVPTEAGWQRFLSQQAQGGTRTGIVRLAPGERLLLVAGPGAALRGDSLPAEAIAAYNRVISGSARGAAALVGDGETQLWPDDEANGAELPVSPNRKLDLVERFGLWALGLAGIALIAASFGLRGVNAEPPPPAIAPAVKASYVQMVAGLTRRGETAETALSRLAPIGVKALPPNFSALAAAPVTPRRAAAPPPTQPQPPAVNPPAAAAAAPADPNTRGAGPAAPPSTRGPERPTATPPPPAPSAAQYGTVKAPDGALLRAEPTTSALVLLRVPSGAKFELLERVDGQAVYAAEARWVKVRYQEKVGYLYLPLVSVSGA